ncbi:MAG: HAMP domain-containing histidine kinase [Dehalococcoidia bacterium]|nr:HAMP domain-containing histidine kinase [Dehalococcoidia bacterium]
MGPLLHVMGNEEKFREVLVNLVENAIKFTSRGEIRVSTNVTGNEVDISVRDTGEGIA